MFFLLSFLGLFLLHFVELASIMSESSDYCQSCERNLYWSMYEIDLDEFNGDVMVAGHSIYVAIIGNWTCAWLLLLLKPLLSFFYVFSSTGSSFLFQWCFVGSETSITIILLIISCEVSGRCGRFSWEDVVNSGPYYYWFAWCYLDRTEK